VTNGRETISTYIKHQLQREAQILDVAEFLGGADATLRSEDGSLWTTWTIVRVLYQAYPENLWLPAARRIDLHLRKLEGDVCVKRVGGEGINARWRLLLSPSLRRIWIGLLVN
jgi:ribonuclease/clavin/mitogillin